MPDHHSNFFVGGVNRPSASERTTLAQSPRSAATVSSSSSQAASLEEVASMQVAGTSAATQAQPSSISNGFGSQFEPYVQGTGEPTASSAGPFGSGSRSDWSDGPNEFGGGQEASQSHTNNTNHTSKTQTGSGAYTIATRAPSLSQGRASSTSASSASASDTTTGDGGSTSTSS